MTYRLLLVYFGLYSILYLVLVPHQPTVVREDIGSYFYEYVSVLWDNFLADGAQCSSWCCVYLWIFSVLIVAFCQPNSCRNQILLVLLCSLPRSFSAIETRKKSAVCTILRAGSQGNNIIMLYVSSNLFVIIFITPVVAWICTALVLVALVLVALAPFFNLLSGGDMCLHLAFPS